MSDLCPCCGTLTMELVGMTDEVSPPAPIKRCTSCEVEVIELAEPEGGAR